MSDKKTFYIFFLTVIIFISGCLGQSKLTIFTANDEVNINIEIADTNEERQKGLMHRGYLDENSGMLFIFDNEQPVLFWMKNTRIPLDMIFVSANGTITEIKEDVQPCMSDPCQIYPSKYPTKYVIEVNAGFSKANNIQVGDSVKMQ